MDRVDRRVADPMSFLNGGRHGTITALQGERRELRSTSGACDGRTDAQSIQTHGSRWRALAVEQDWLDGVTPNKPNN